MSGYQGTILDFVHHVVQINRAARMDADDDLLQFLRPREKIDRLYLKFLVVAAKLAACPREFASPNCFTTAPAVSP